MKVLSTLLLLLTAVPTWGYIDPGTGMTYVSGIGPLVMGFLALIFGTLVVTAKKWISFLKNRFSKKGHK